MSAVTAPPSSIGCVRVAHGVVGHVVLDQHAVRAVDGDLEKHGERVYNMAMVESFARGVSVVQLVKRFVKSAADFHVYLKENSRI